MRGFTFNGKHCSVFNVIMRSKNRQLLPATNDGYVQVPGRHGSIHIPQGLQDRTIVLECAFNNQSITDMRTKAREIASWLYAREKKALVFDDEPNVYYVGKCSSGIDLDHKAKLGMFTLTFRCEPFAYASDITVDDAASAYLGTAEASCIITAVATAGEALTVTNEQTDEFVKIIHTFVGGETVVIDTEKQLTLIDAVDARPDVDVTSDYFQLYPGNYSLIITGGAISKVEYRMRYI